MAKNQRLDATITIGSVLKKTVGRDLGSISSGLEKIGAEMRGVRDQQRALSKQRKVLEKEGQSVDALDREYEALSRTLEDLTRKQDRYKRAQAASARVGDTFGRMVGDVGRLARDTALGIGTLGAALAGVTTKVAGNTEELNRWARRLGVSAEFLSQLQFAAGKFGVQNDALIDGLKELSLRADEFAVTGKGPAAEAFDRIGLSARDAGALAGDTAALFSVVRDRMSEIQDPAARQRIADELFGGTAAEQMIELLAISRAEIEALGAEAQKAGAVVTGAQADMAREYTQSFNRLGGVIEGLTRTVAMEMMPTLTEAFRDIGDLLIENRDAAAELGRALTVGLKEALPVARDIASGIGKVADQVGAVIVGVKDMLGGWEEFGTAIGVIFAGKAIASVIRFVGSFRRFAFAVARLAPALPAVAAGIGTIVAAVTSAPILIGVGAVAAIAAGAALIVKNWGKIKEGIGPVIEWLGEKLDWILGKMGRVTGGFLMGGVPGAVAAQVLGGGQAPAASSALASPYAVPSALLPRPGAGGPPARSGAPVSGPQVTNHNQITINAQNMTAEQVMDELERRLRTDRGGALYDPATSTGQYGGGAHE